MTDEIIRPDTVLESVNWEQSNGEIITRLADPADPRNTTNADQWVEAADLDSDVTLTVAHPDPSGNLDGEQTFVIRVRSSDNDVGDPASATFELREDSTLIQAFETDASVTQDQDGETWIGTWDATDISNASDVEMRILGDSTGGKPGVRDTVEVGAFRWEAQVAPSEFVEVVTVAPTGLSDTEATLEGEVEWDDTDVDVWFEWGEVGSGFPNQTTVQTFTTPGTDQFDETLTGLSSDTEYEYRAHAELATEETDQGAIISFWTAPEEPAAPTNLDASFSNE